MTESLVLFDVRADFHGTSVGLARHTAAGEALCCRCQAFVDELAAAGLAAPLNEAGRPARPPITTPVTASAPMPKPVRKPVSRVIDEVAKQPGLHPLSRLLGVQIALHEQAGPAGGDYHLGLRCGGCRHRQVAPPAVSGRAFPKCAVRDWERASHAVGTDVLSYRQACVDYEPRDADAPDQRGGS